MMEAKNRKNRFGGFVEADELVTSVLPSMMGNKFVPHMPKLIRSGWMILTPDLNSMGEKHPSRSDCIPCQVYFEKTCNCLYKNGFRCIKV